jgi:tRNA (pseudouridine54-N1)-methyltransferase
MHDAGRLDIAYECAVAALFLSHAIRKDTTFHMILNGPPNPPLHIRVQGESLYDVRTDLQSWQQILKKTLSGRAHPGVALAKTSFETLVKFKASESQIYVLEEHGKDITDVGIGNEPIFILGDHVGLPKRAESFALRYGEKISLGKQPYLAATCITILNYLLDRKMLSC